MISSAGWAGFSGTKIGTFSIFKHLLLVSTGFPKGVPRRPRIDAFGALHHVKVPRIAMMLRKSARSKGDERILCDGDLVKSV
ncbi:MAG: hypothetical protein PVG78_09035, partial [Desulfobacterales bacterium]